MDNLKESRKRDFYRDVFTALYSIALKIRTLHSQPSECGLQHTLNIVHAQTAAQQQSNGSYEARMSGKCGEWRD